MRIEMGNPNNKYVMCTEKNDSKRNISIKINLGGAR